MKAALFEADALAEGGDVFDFSITHKGNAGSSTLLTGDLGYNGGAALAANNTGDTFIGITGVTWNGEAAVKSGLQTSGWGAGTVGEKHIAIAAIDATSAGIYQVTTAGAETYTVENLMNVTNFAANQVDAWINALDTVNFTTVTNFF